MSTKPNKWHVADSAERIYERAVQLHIRQMLKERSQPEPLPCDRIIFQNLALTAFEAAEQFAAVEEKRP